MFKLITACVTAIALTLSLNVRAESFGDVAKSIGIERSIYCYYAGANLDLKDGYGSAQAKAVGSA